MSRNKEAVREGELRAANGRGWLQIAAAMAVAAPGPVIRTLEVAGLVHLGLASGVESAIFGVTIFAAASMLIWATEVAEQLISAMLALAVLAVVAVLPEYAVDLYFAWPTVFFLFWLRERKRDLVVGEANSIGLLFLGAATIYSFSIPLRGHLSLIDSAVLISLFVVYLVLSSRAPPRDEQVLVGPAQTIAALPLRWRWATVIGIFAFAAGTIFAAAEPFAEGPVDSGESLGIDEFIL